MVPKTDFTVSGKKKRWDYASRFILATSFLFSDGISLQSNKTVAKLQLSNMIIK